MHLKPHIRISILLIAQLFATGLFAQITIEGTPVQLVNSFSDDALEVNWDDQKYLSLDQNGANLPLAGITQEVDIDAIKSGYWMLLNRSG